MTRLRELISTSLGQPLSKSEASSYRGQLIEAIHGFSEAADGFISKTNRQRAVAEIWSTIDDKDAAILADALLSVAARSGQVAYVVRGGIRTWTIYKAGAITLPKALATLQFYAEHGGFALWMPTAVSAS